MQNGFLLINKDTSWTSADVCNKLKSHFQTKRIGHAGTLDPFATGLLLIAVGRYTRLLKFFDNATKTYTTTIVLGKTSATLDPESEIIDCDFIGKIPTITQIEQKISRDFSKECWQTPPAFSAIKVQGVRAYKLARKKTDFTLKPRKTYIHDCKILDYKFPELTLEITVASGFYIRQLADDLGKQLAGGGYCKSLQRTKINNLSLKNSRKITENLELLEASQILPQFPVVEISESRIPDFSQGRAFDITEILLQDKYNVDFLNKNLPEVFVRNNKTSQIVGLGEIKNKLLHPKILLQ